jgi:phosphoglycerol transferase MdoB-like AlkP superfamily enzyme
MILILFFYAFLLTLGFYSLERLQFLLWNWSFYKHQPFTDLLLAFLHGLRFDLSAIALLSAIPFLLMWIVQTASGWKPVSIRNLRILMLIFVLFHLPAMVMNLGDAEFINFLGRRYTFDALFLLREIPGKASTLFFFYWPFHLLNFFIMAFFAALAVLWLPRILPCPVNFSWKRSLLAGTGILLCLLVASRGGLQSKPLNFAHAQIFLNPSMNNLLLNSPFTFLQTIRRQSLPRDQFFSNEEMLQILRKTSNQTSLLDGHRFPRKPNVVLIILESFSLEFFGKANTGEGYTPFLDSLASKSLFFDHAYANARRSIEGIGAIIGGVPALMNEPFISSQYLTNYYLGLGTLLQPEGYHTSFFHGAQPGSMYFDQFMRSAGIKHHFSLANYPRPQETDGTWGIWDEPFLQWMSEQLGSFPEPFFSSVFSLTSHNPFKLPSGYEGKFPRGTSEIHQTVGYTDYALQKFFESASKQPWYQNTIFIITADHTYKPVKSQYNNELGWYKIPLLIYSPGFKLPEVDQRQVVQHIDLLPTILDLVGVDMKERNYLGQSIFVPGDRSAVCFTDGNYLLVAQDYFLRHKQGGEFQMFSTRDSDEKMALSEPENRKKELTDRLKATIQYFSQGMWDNKLYYPTGR